jgi:hypothetical protein
MLGRQARINCRAGVPFRLTATTPLVLTVRTASGLLLGTFHGDRPEATEPREFARPPGWQKHVRGHSLVSVRPRRAGWSAVPFVHWSAPSTEVRGGAMGRRRLPARDEADVAEEATRT